MTNIWQKKGDEGTNIALLCANHRLFKGQGSHTLATNRKRERVRHWVSGWVGRRGREQAPSVGIVQPIWLLCTKSYSVGRGWGSSTQVSRSANRNSKSNLAGGGLGGGVTSDLVGFVCCLWLCLSKRVRLIRSAGWGGSCGRITKRGRVKMWISLNLFKGDGTTARTARTKTETKHQNSQ